MMTPRAKKTREPDGEGDGDSAKSDWFEALDEELEQRAKDLRGSVDAQAGAKRVLNDNLIRDFWRIWIRFSKIDVLFTMEPVHSDFAVFQAFPEKWTERAQFKPETVNRIRLTDTTQAQNRIGDTLEAHYYFKEDKLHIQLLFEYCEGESYYKYAGWKRTYVQYVLYESEADDADLDVIHDILGNIVKNWYSSHLKRDRNLMLDYVKENYPKGRTYTQ